jgi:NAD(P)-dependent dehydrogenase (short-subunit alcohol dehydrogenase family)
MKRTALVTGANRGIGLAIARELAERGHAVWLGSRDLDAGEEAAHPLSRLGLEVTAIHVDLTKPETIDSSAERIDRSRAPVDVLVNNAGVL